MVSSYLLSADYTESFTSIYGQINEEQSLIRTVIHSVHWHIEKPLSDNHSSRKKTGFYSVLTSTDPKARLRAWHRTKTFRTGKAEPPKAGQPALRPACQPGHTETSFISFSIKVVLRSEPANRTWQNPSSRPRHKTRAVLTENLIPPPGRHRLLI